MYIVSLLSPSARSLSLSLSLPCARNFPLIHRSRRAYSNVSAAPMSSPAPDTCTYFYYLYARDTHTRIHARTHTECGVLPVTRRRSPMPWTRNTHNQIHDAEFETLAKTTQSLRNVLSFSLFSVLLFCLSLLVRILARFARDNRHVSTTPEETANTAFPRAASRYAVKLRYNPPRQSLVSLAARN